MHKLKFLLYATCLFLFVACKKDFHTSSPQNGIVNPDVQMHRDDPNPCVEQVEDDKINDDVTVLTVLGDPLSGHPYSVEIMQQASINLYGTDSGIIANKKYIRYRATDEDQLKILSDDTTIELFDHPLDCQVLVQGDYYPQPGIAPDEIPWFYTVVDINYQPIASIRYEVIEELYVPANDLYLENEAFVLTGNSIDEYCNGVNYRPAPEPPCPDPGDPLCPQGGGGGGTPPVDTKKPAGFIRVFDTNFGVAVPVRRTRVVARRWLKIDHMYTDDNGRYQSNKRFLNKVTILVKFHSPDLSVRGLQSVAFWQMFFPIKRNIGTYSGNLSNIDALFNSTHQGRGRLNRNWWAAQLMNAYLEFDQHAITMDIGHHPDRMIILLTSLSFAEGSGSTPMNGHRILAGNWPVALVNQFLVNPTAFPQLSALSNYLYTGTLTRFIDMSLGYHTETPRSSDRVKALMYHELAHASHFHKVGEIWWGSFVASEVSTIITHLNSAANPYGHGNDGTASEYISVGESWAEHVARWMDDLQYGLNSNGFSEQGVNYFNGSIIAGSSHINYLENFRPTLTDDPFHWIPYGIYWDLMDDRNDNIFNPVHVIDLVSGYYTNQRLFAALDNDVTSMPQYRARLLSENNNNQSAEVTQLFTQYGF